MEAKDLARLLTEALEKRNARIAEAVREIVSANDEYLALIDGARGFRKSLVKGDFPPIMPESLILSKFDGWEKLELRLSEPKSDFERIRSILPPLNERFGTADLKRRFAEAYPGYDLKESVWPVYLQRLRTDGYIIRIKATGNHGVYAVAGSQISSEAEYKSQPDIAIDILREKGPMTVNEIIVELRKRGVGKDSKTETLETNLTRGLRRRPEQVHIRGNKWRVNSTTTEA